MKTDFIVFLKRNFSAQTFDINRLLVSAFVSINKLKVSKNQLIKSYLIGPEDNQKAALNKLIGFIISKDYSLGFEELVELFEFVISPADKLINGAVYTPRHIREFTINKSLSILENTTKDLLVADIACGCGCFMYSAAWILKKNSTKSYKEIYKNQLFGLDIADYSIERTKIVLSLWALNEGEDEDFEFNLFLGNTLSFDWSKNSPAIKENKGFDLIVGNPPYVSAKNIAQESKDLLKNWSVSKGGSADLYIPFFQIGYESLSPNGVLGYITVNSFINSLNGRSLRAYFKEKMVSLTIYNFGGQQIFTNRLTYTCLCFLQRKPSENVYYCNADHLGLKKLYKLNKIAYQDLDTSRGWILGRKTIVNDIKTIESTGRPLGDIFEIRNGFATLKNNVFLFVPFKENNKYYFLKNKMGEFAIEKLICRDAVKPNILKTHEDIEKFKEKLIFPYEKVSHNASRETPTKNVQLIKEEQFKLKFPKAYFYLEQNKAVLATRDKGQGNYEAWYAFGRNQSLSITGPKLLFPYISDKPYFVLSEEHDLLFYNGYAVLSDDLQALKILKKILESSLFWHYIQHSSKPYSHNYFALAKNLIKNFGICNFSPEEKLKLMSFTNLSQTDEFLLAKYKIDIDNLRELQHAIGSSAVLNQEKELMFAAC